jgi:hypothetical protein
MHRPNIAIHAWHLADLFGHSGKWLLLQAAGIAVEFPNPFSQLLRRYGVLVVHPAEGLFVQVDLLILARLCFCRTELALGSALGVFQLIEQLWANGKQIASGRPDNLICVSETRAHHLRLISIFLIVLVDAHDRRNSRILVGRDLRAIVLSLMPIVNAAHEVLACTIVTGCGSEKTIDATG